MPTMRVAVLLLALVAACSGQAKAPDGSADSKASFFQTPEIVAVSSDATATDAAATEIVPAGAPPCLTASGCQGSSNPCAVPACDHGHCTLQPTPDGTECGKKTGCGAATCVAGQCQPADPFAPKLWPDAAAVTVRGLCGDGKLLVGSAQLAGSPGRAAWMGWASGGSFGPAGGGAVLWQGSFAIELIACTAGYVANSGFQVQLAGWRQTTAAAQRDAVLLRADEHGAVVGVTVSATGGASEWTAAGQGKYSASRAVAGTVFNTATGLDARVWRDTADPNAVAVFALPDDQYVAAMAASESGYSTYLCGYTAHANDPADGWAAGLDGNGVLLWQTQFGDKGHIERIHACSAAEGGVMLFGTAHVAAGDSEIARMFTVFVNNYGSVAWQRRQAMDPTLPVELRAAVAMPNDRFAAAGFARVKAEDRPLYALFDADGYLRAANVLQGIGRGVGIGVASYSGVEAPDDLLMATSVTAPAMRAELRRVNWVGEQFCGCGPFAQTCAGTPGCVAAGCAMPDCSKLAGDFLGNQCVLASGGVGVCAIEGCVAKK